MNKTSQVLAKQCDSESLRQTLVRMGKGMLPKEIQAVADLIAACSPGRGNSLYLDAHILAAFVSQMQNAVDTLATAGWEPARIARMRTWGEAWLAFLCPE